MTALRLLCCIFAAVALAPNASALATDDTAEMSPTTLASVKRSLASLARSQRDDGSFQGYAYGDNTAGVSAACLAFLGAGHAPSTGEYGTVVARALKFIMRTQQPNGVLFRDGMIGGPMYHHGLGTLTLAEAFGMTQDRQLRAVLKKACDLIVATQNPQGGWRYHPTILDGADLSVTVMQLMALRACKDAGIFVPQETIDSGITLVKKCHNSAELGRDGGFAYTFGGGSTFACSGAGLLSLQVAGNYRAKEVREAVQYLMTYYPVGQTKNTDTVQILYGNYYASMGIYQTQSIGDWGRKAWAAWYPAICKYLISQATDKGVYGIGAYGTGVALLVLEIPCRYLPIYQR
jgi:hypothetical protein